MQNKFVFIKKKYLDWEIQYYPDHLNYKSIIENIIISYKKKNYQSLENYINILNTNFAFIAKYKNYSIACVDQISSYPIYYTNKKGLYHFASNIFDLDINLQDKKNYIKHHELEMLMSGYISENRTLLKNVFQLEAGSFVISPDNKTYDYYIHYPIQLKKTSDENLINEIDRILNKIFNSIYIKYHDYKIIVPLSGGLDSRLILGKLKEFGFKNLLAVSYGPKYNSEAKIAKLVSKKLQVPWKFYLSDKKISKEIFYSKDLKNYWNFSTNFSKSPNMQEFQFLYELNRKKLLDDKTLILNGQTGDFISGGHIPINLIDQPSNKEIMLRYILDKHYSLWKNLKTKNNINKISEILENYKCFSKINKLTQINYAYLYNLWEWRERQSKFVINQQKLYDFYKVKWELPLWNIDFMKFWRDIPLNNLKNKSLYIKYLKNWNYMNIFTDQKINFKRFDKQEINRWPGLTYIYFIVGKIIGLILGNKLKIKFYNYTKYFGHYSNYYQSFGYLHYFKHANNLRNPQSLFTLKYILDLKKHYIK